jgi:hypothetical protein
LGAYTVSLALVGLVWLVSTLTGREEMAGNLLLVFLFGWVLYSWVANALISSRT